MTEDHEPLYVLRKEQAIAYGQPFGNGRPDFLVKAGSTAMRNGSPNEKRDIVERDRLVEEGILVEDANPLLFRFSVDHVFSSKSRAAGVVIDGNSNGSHWKIDIRGGEDTPATLYSRDAIEAAMDAYEAYRKSGAGAEIFDSFGAPRDYWVRSTRKRENRVFPTKALLGHLRHRSAAGIHGGFTHKENAASVLHNSGFIIVDAEDQPTTPTKEREYLIRDADRIRLCALNYHIAPGREQGAAQVSIRAGTFHNELGLERSWANVCQVLAGEKFRNLAGLPEPMIEGPELSTTTIFTFRLDQDDERQSMTLPKTLPAPTNLILYGPPGTGKTYATAREAVRLCLGEAAAPLEQDRPALMAEYRRLCDEGRIEFTTFHQSMSYEDFVEGLRPETESGVDTGFPEAAPLSGGFSLRPHDGIFRMISERARLDAPDNAVRARLDRKRDVIRLGLRGAAWQQSLQQMIDAGCLDWQPGGDVDWSGTEYEEWEAIKARRSQDDPDVVGNGPTVYGTWIVRARAVVGDYLMVTVGQNRIVAFGRFAGGYEYAPATSDVPARHRRRVDWIWSDPDGIDRKGIYSAGFTSLHPLHVMFCDKLDWDHLEAAVLGAEAEQPAAAARPFVLIIDEINRANISKVFGELITLLEPDKRLGAANEIRLRLPYSGKLFGVPSNLHIIGTMNTADRSIALLDTALRRRFTFQELMPDPVALRDALAAAGHAGGVVDDIDLPKLLVTLNARIEYLFDREHQLGHAYFTACRSRADIDAVMRDKVIPLLAEYFHEDLSKVALVLGDAPGRPARFLQGQRLLPPAGLPESDFAEEKWRWQVGDTFDFAEFEADRA